MQGNQVIAHPDYFDRPDYIASLEQRCNKGDVARVNGTIVEALRQMTPPIIAVDPVSYVNLGPKTARVCVDGRRKIYIKFYTLDDMEAAIDHLNKTMLWKKGRLWEIATDFPSFSFKYYASPLGLYSAQPQSHNSPPPPPPRAPSQGPQQPQPTTAAAANNNNSGGPFVNQQQQLHPLPLPPVALVPRPPVIVVVSSSAAVATTTTPPSSSSVASETAAASVGAYKTADDTTIGPKLASGGYGVVHKGTCHGAQIAMKLFKDAKTSATSLASAEYELNIFKKVNGGPNIVQLCRPVWQGNDLALMLELLECDIHALVYSGAPGSIIEALNLNSPFLALPDILYVAEKAALGLHWAHEDRVIHSDVKPENFLLAQTLDCKLSDFGLAIDIPDCRPIEQIYQSGQDRGTLPYLSPEVVLYEHISYKSDIFSFGVLMCEILSRKPPYYPERVDHNFLVSKFSNGGGDHLKIIPNQYWESREALPVRLVKLIQDCLAIEPAKRPECMYHVAYTLRMIRAELLCPSTKARSTWLAAGGLFLQRHPVMPWDQFYSNLNSDPTLLSLRPHICDPTGHYVYFQKLSALATSQGWS
ncbi:serine/threonine protein kinase [Pelomyxa schiedti]|nr:serine/threonine protein kinase [Pelomyxa schiedti]